VDEFQFFDALFLGDRQSVERQFLVAAEKNLPRLRIVNVRRQHLAGQIRFLDGDALDSGVHNFFKQRPGELAALLDDDFVRFRILDILRRLLSGKRFIHGEVNFFAFQRDLLDAVKVV